MQPDNNDVAVSEAMDLARDIARLLKGQPSETAMMAMIWTMASVAMEVAGGSSERAIELVNDTMMPGVVDAIPYLTLEGEHHARSH